MTPVTEGPHLLPHFTMCVWHEDEIRIHCKARLFPKTSSLPSEAHRKIIHPIYAINFFHCSVAHLYLQKIRMTSHWGISKWFCFLKLEKQNVAFRWVLIVRGSVWGWAGKDKEAWQWRSRWGNKKTRVTDWSRVSLVMTDNGNHIQSKS